jgi:hypothetical protein
MMLYMSTTICCSMQTNRKVIVKSEVGFRYLT